jgi:signal transduction histidine kinase
MDHPSEKPRIEADPRLKDLLLKAIAHSKSGWRPDALNGSMRLSILELFGLSALVVLSPGLLLDAAFLIVASALAGGSIGRTRLWIKSSESEEYRRHVSALSVLGGFASGALPMLAQEANGLDPTVLITALLVLASSIHLSSRTAVAIAYVASASISFGLAVFVLRPGLGPELFAPMGIGLFLSLISIFVASRLPRLAAAAARNASPSAQQREHASFIANMSHELRTPLNAIIGFSEMMRNQVFGPLGSSKYQEYNTDIYDSGQHLLSIINDILDLSKLESGKMTLNERAVDLVEVARRANSQISSVARKAKVAVEAVCDCKSAVIRGDERLILQSCLNLLSNAVKFTPEGGRVTLKVSAFETGSVVVSVEDTGIGIAPENIDKVMQPFGQVESVQSRKHQGTGLGLPLVKSFIELHGGTFELQSELGRGTTAIAIFPERLRISNAPNVNSQRPETDLEGADAA